LPSVVLAPFVGAHDPLTIRHCNWPLETLSECVPDQGPGRGVIPADPAMDPGVTPFLEVPFDDNEGLSMVCEPQGLHFVSWEHLAEEVVKIRHPLVSRRVGLRR
jgi:hypothetical protein